MSSEAGKLGSASISKTRSRAPVSSRRTETFTKLGDISRPRAIRSARSRLVAGVAISMRPSAAENVVTLASAASRTAAAYASSSSGSGSRAV